MITLSDGTRLHARLHPADNAKGVVVLVHGLGEHSGRYAHVVDAFVAAGWSAVTYDHRGHGRSGGARGALPHADALLEDLEQVIDFAIEQTGLQRVMLFGHSMGGAVAARFVADARRPIAGLVLSSPGLARKLSIVDRIRLLAGRLTPNLAVNNGLDVTKIAHDPAVVAAYQSDALNHDRITPRLALFILGAGPHVMRAAPRWSVPTLLLWAGDDHLVDPRGSAAFRDAAARNVVEAREFPRLYHEIFNESDREVFAALRAWLDRR